MKYTFNKQQEKRLLKIQEKTDKKAKEEVIHAMKQTNEFMEMWKYLIKE